MKQNLLKRNIPAAVISGFNMRENHQLLWPISGERDGKQVQRFLYYKNGKFVPEKDVFSDGGTGDNWSPVESTPIFDTNIVSDNEHKFAKNGKRLTINPHVDGTEVSFSIKGIGYTQPVTLSKWEGVTIQYSENVIEGVKVNGTITYILTN